MRKIIAILVLASCLAACGMINTLVDGYKHSQAVASDLEQVKVSTGTMGGSSR